MRLSSLKNLPTFQSCVPVLTWKANLKRKVFKKIKCRQNLKLWIQINYKTNFHSSFFLGYFFVNSLKIAATKVQINYLKFSCFYMFVLGKWFISSSLNSSNFSIPPPILILGKKAEKLYICFILYFLSSQANSIMPSSTLKHFSLCLLHLLLKFLLGKISNKAK